MKWNILLRMFNFKEKKNYIKEISLHRLKRLKEINSLSLTKTLSAIVPLDLIIEKEKDLRITRYTKRTVNSFDPIIRP